MIRLTLSLFLISCFQPVTAQLYVPASFGNGVSIMAGDSSFLVNIGFRFQTLYTGQLDLNTNEWTDQMLIRRSRLRFKGFAFSPDVQYKVELGLSNRDLGGGKTAENGTTPNLILDALIRWNLSDNLTLQFGQGKLPGNRERIISSQQLQFVDRSLVNSRFNLDRDIGLQLKHTQAFGEVIFRKTFSVSIGEGRNVVIDNQGGYNYTARLEVLPFGKFEGKGDYFGSDLARESRPKLAVAVAGDYNDGAVRSRSQLGSWVYDADGNVWPANMTTLFADAMYKHRGFSAMSEFARRWIENPGAPFTTGTGFVIQAGYLLKSDWEFAGRFAGAWADTGTSALSDETRYSVGISRYISGHDLKFQSDVTYMDSPGGDEILRYRCQVEVAF